MGQPTLPVPVKLFIAVTFGDEEIFEAGIKLLEQEFGSFDIRSAIFDFNHTRYYFEEMGEGLKKQLFAFKKSIYPDTLPEVKLKTNHIEDQFKNNGKRRINIDPGYLTCAKVVLATTKNFDHRIYLGKGIYGDVHLRYRHNKFIFNPWTYPDYRDKLVIDFLAKLRKKYCKELEKISKSRENINND